ncbi:uncharacterized protein RAG0_05007 [Rhynchosporium agropyri]|uniref:Uncharacterized protein n=1 Tax=Rhynchosporium agropyri TaxID=914238 RepID=A0A1E1KB22_9HELO|nr:uncharacterized protein RAG0_05007 [Rhynchosporium agropyri]
MLTPHPRSRSSLPANSHFLQTTNIPAISPSIATTSPKRKRGLPAIATIPPTPPRSSPTPDHDPSYDSKCVPRSESAPDMLLTLNIPGATVNEAGREGEREATEGGEEGASSPRTKVAYNFQGLRLEDASSRAGGGRFELDEPVKRKQLVEGWGGNGAFDDLIRQDRSEDVVMDGEARWLGEDDSDQQVARKRIKVVQKPIKKVEVPETPQRISPGALDLGAAMGTRVGRRKEEEKKFAIFFESERAIDSALREAPRRVTLSDQVDEMVFMGNGTSDPSLTRPLSKPRRKRAGTPPLTGSLSSLSVSDTHDDLERDPSSLTWHDDEITGHDPTDPDDDGEGINGIGFKPTPAEAYARTQKRRQQMAEYRNREAREARKMRSERRRGNERPSKEEEKERRVRFMEGVEVGGGSFRESS